MAMSPEGDFTFLLSLSFLGSTLALREKVKYKKLKEKKNTFGARYDVMVKKDSHMIDHGLNLRPVMFHTPGLSVCLVPKSQEENGAEGIVL